MYVLKKKKKWNLSPPDTKVYSHEGNKLEVE